MSKILIAGDTHCSRIQVEYLYRIAKKNTCDLIIQVGDFGYWPNDESGQGFLAGVNYLGKNSGIELWWLDGNHEDHDMLDAMVEYRAHVESPPYTTASAKDIYPYVRHLPRGYRFEIDGIKFMSYGGAFSVDRDGGVEGIHWFPQEIVDLDHVRTLSDEPIDILLSHDVPWGYNFGYNELSPIGAASANSRYALLELCYKVQPKVVIGGHHHRRVDYEIYCGNDKPIDCHVINCNGTFDDSWAIIDTELLKAEWSANGL